MARKSRKNVVISTENQVEHIYKVAIYARLSFKDNNTKNTDTIQHQIDMIEEFISTQNDMVIFKKYIDNGRTGVDFNRPAFQEMMEDMLSKKFDCIIVRDLSRLGRDYISTGHYIENTFPYYNIRFISIKEGKDSANPDNDNTEFVLGLTNILNNLYAKDTSIKVWNTFDTKLKNGESLGTIPYGYLRDENKVNRLRINYEVSENIIKIFEMRLQNMSYTDIARVLNKQGVLSPYKYKVEKGMYLDKTNLTYKLWSAGMISYILKDIIYIGYKIERKQIKYYAENIPITILKKSEYKIISNSHQPIIDEDVFNKVQEMNNKISKKKSRKRYQPINSIFKGLVRCKECNKMLAKTKLSKDIKFYCRLTIENRDLDICCTEKIIFEKQLYKLIVKEISNHIALSKDFNQKLENIKTDRKYQQTKKRLDNKINKIEIEIQSISNKKVNLYTSFFENRINQETYLSSKNELEKLYEKLLLDKERTVEEQNKENFFIDKENEWIDNILKNQSIDNLTAELLNNLIDTIYLTADSEIEIVWKFQENYNQLSKYLGGLAI